MLNLMMWNLYKLNMIGIKLFILEWAGFCIRQGGVLICIKMIEITWNGSQEKCNLDISGIDKCHCRQVIQPLLALIGQDVLKSFQEQMEFWYFD